jgi:hypothetical protein
MILIYSLSSKNSVFGSDCNYSVQFQREKYRSSEFGFFESRLRRIYARLALGANFAQEN